MSLLSWARSLEHSLVAEGHRIADRVETGAKWAFEHPGEAARALEHAALAGAGAAYNLVIGNDIKTLMDPKAPRFERVLAGVSIASKFVGPEGKMLDKGLTMIARGVAEHGGARLAVEGAEMLERTLVKETMQLLAKNGVSLAGKLARTIGDAEKALDTIEVSRGAADGVKKTIEDTRQTLVDIGIAYAAPPAERARAWERVAEDLAQTAADATDAFSATKSAIDEAAPPSRADLQHRAEKTLLQDAERIKAESRTFVDGKTMLIDVRDGKNVRESTMTKLEALGADAKADGKIMVVYDPNMSPEQTSALRAKGISVAKSAGDLRKLSVASRVAGAPGVELVNMYAGVQNSDLMRMYRERKGNDSLESDANDPHTTIKGEPHESATPWNGTAQWQGRISAVTENGTIELSVGRDKYVTFDAKQAAQLGIDPRKVELNEYVDVYRSNDPDQALRADVAASAAALPQRHADQQIGANR